MEISANTSQAQLSTQQNIDRNRDDNRVELETNQSNAPVEAEDRATSAEPVQETTASETTQNQNNEQVTRERNQAPAPEETLGNQIDIRA